jgi:branched-chain amino acid transport system substrate-binding protein
MLHRTISRLSLLAFAVALVASEPAAAQSSADTLKIGVLNDMSGPYAEITGQQSVTAVQMAIEDFGGTVLGRKIEVLVADHQNKPDVGASIARRWLDQDGVDVIVGLGASSVALAVRSLTREKGKLDIATSTGTSDMTGPACSPTGFHWMHDTYALANTVGTAIVKSGGTNWFFITADYAFGHALERDASRFVEGAGGKVTGKVRVPINTADFSSFLLHAQGSKASVIAFANAGADLINSVKQAREFGLSTGSQRLASFLLMINEVNALGLDVAQGMLLAEGFYWDQSDEARRWSQRFFERRKLMPNMMNAGDYSATLHYLKAVKAAGTAEARAVAEKMRELPIDDPMTKQGRIRPDGRVEREMYLFRVKAPAESKSPWDYYSLVATIPASQAFRPMTEGNCPLVSATR